MYILYTDYIYQLDSNYLYINDCPVRFLMTDSKNNILTSNFSTSLFEVIFCHIALFLLLFVHTKTLLVLVFIQIEFTS